MANITDLPAEVLLRIFQFYLEYEWQINLLHVLSKVCRSWKAICLDKSLFVKFDGSLKYKSMMKLCADGSLDKIKELTISSVKVFKDKDAAKLFNRLHNVEALNLSQVELFSSKAVFSILSRSRLKLKTIQIGNAKSTEKALSLLNLDPGEERNTLGHKDLEKFFVSKGTYLTNVILSECLVFDVNKLMECLPKNCPNLEYFVCKNIFDRDRLFVALPPHGEFPTKLFQSNCPKLKSLLLDYSLSIGVSDPESSGFPNLRVFTYGDKDSLPIIPIHKIRFERILFNSPNLEILSLTNCSLSPERVEMICLLPANSLKYLQLYLSDEETRYLKNLSIIFEKWCHSLKGVAFRNSDSSCVNDAIFSLISLPTASPIEILDLQKSAVTRDTVKNILEKCKNLKALNLVECENLDEEFKKKYRGEEQLKVLYEKLLTIDDSSEEK